MSSGFGLRDLRVCDPLTNIANRRRPRRLKGRLRPPGAADALSVVADMPCWRGPAKGDALVIVVGGNGCCVVAGMQAACRGS
jgi:hypothetical protein